MEVKEKKTVDMLTPDGVSIMTSQFVSLDGEMVQILSLIHISEPTRP